MANRRDELLVLAGDIGGTKTNLGIFRQGKTRPSLKVTATYSSREAPNLEYIIEQFLDSAPRNGEPETGAPVAVFLRRLPGPEKRSFTVRTFWTLWSGYAIGS